MTDVSFVQGWLRVASIWRDVLVHPLGIWSALFDVARNGSRLEVGMFALLAVSMTLAWPIMVLALPFVLAFATIMLAFAWCVGALIGGLAWAWERARLR